MRKALPIHVYKYFHILSSFSHFSLFIHLIFLNTFLYIYLYGPQGPQPITISYSFQILFVSEL